MIVAYVEDWCHGRDTYCATVHHTGNLVDGGGTVIGRYVVTGAWLKQYPYQLYKMASLRAFIDGKEYTGKLGYEWSQAVRLRRSTRKED